MSVIAHLALGDAEITIQTNDDELFTWPLNGEIREVPMMGSIEDTLTIMRCHGLRRIMDASGHFSPTLDSPDFPLLKPKTLADGEIVTVISGVMKPDGTEVPF